MHGLDGQRALLAIDGLFVPDHERALVPLPADDRETGVRPRLDRGVAPVRVTDLGEQVRQVVEALAVPESVDGGQDTLPTGREYPSLLRVVELVLHVLAKGEVAVDADHVEPRPEADVLIVVEVGGVGQPPLIDLAHGLDQPDPVTVDQLPAALDPLEGLVLVAQVGLAGPRQVVRVALVEKCLQRIVVVRAAHPQVTLFNLLGEAQRATTFEPLVPGERVVVLGVPQPRDRQRGGQRLHLAADAEDVDSLALADASPLQGESGVPLEPAGEGLFAVGHDHAVP